jgi:phosphatidylglycerol:prolipoprotein diacylglycerol transferase
MWPVLVRVPFLDVAVSTYGALMVAGIVAGIALAAWLGSRDRVEPERMVMLGLVVAVASTLGAKASWFVNHPGAIAFGDVAAGRARPGALIYGGLVTGVVASVALARAMRLEWRVVADACAPGVALGIALGRVGCFAAGCCWGAPCDHAWGVLFPVATLEVAGAPLGTALHPTQLYEAAFAAVICVALVALHRRRRFRGEVAAWLFVLYPIARFAVECFRGDDRGELFGLAGATGLSPAQIISIALCSLALPAAVSLGRGPLIRRTSERRAA